MNKLIEFVKNYKQSNPSGWRKWIFGTLAFLAVVLIVAVGVVIQTFRSREIAKLKHERDVAREKARQAVVDQHLAKNDEAIGRHMKASEEALERFNELSRKVTELESTHQQRKELIDSIRSWEDVDAKVR